MPELIIVPRGHLESPFVRESDEFSSLLLVNRERLLDIDVTSVFQTMLCNMEMALWWRRDMDHVWPGLAQKSS